MIITIAFFIKLHDNFSEFDCFVNDDADWKIIKIGDLDEDYEPGYISTRNYVEWKCVMPEIHGQEVKHFIFEELPRLTKCLAKIRGKDHIISKSIVVSPEYRPENLGSIFELTNSEIIELSKYDIDISVFPQMDWYVDGSDPDGRLFAKYVNEII